LPEEELAQFRQSQKLNMDRVELVQELVFDIYNKWGLGGLEGV